MTHLETERLGDACGNSSGIALQADGSYFVGFGFVGTQTFGGITFEASGTDGLVASVDADGHYLWMQHLAGRNHVEIRALAANPAGQVFVEGDFRQEINLGDGLVTVPTRPSTVRSWRPTTWTVRWRPAGEAC